MACKFCGIEVHSVEYKGFFVDKKTGRDVSLIMQFDDDGIVTRVIDEDGDECITHGIIGRHINDVDKDREFHYLARRFF